MTETEHPLALNKERVTRITLATRAVYGPSTADDTESIDDVLCDALHWAASIGLDPKETIDRAMGNYEGERHHHYNIEQARELMKRTIDRLQANELANMLSTTFTNGPVTVQDTQLGLTSDMYHQGTRHSRILTP